MLLAAADGMSITFNNNIRADLGQWLLQQDILGDFNGIETVACRAIADRSIRVSSDNLVGERASGVRSQDRLRLGQVMNQSFVGQKPARNKSDEKQQEGEIQALKTHRTLPYSCQACERKGVVAGNSSARSTALGQQSAEFKNSGRFHKRRYHMPGLEGAVFRAGRWAGNGQGRQNNANCSKCGSADRPDRP